MNEPIRVLNLFTIMNRGGAETMVMNHYRNIDRTKVQFDFLVHRQERGAYDDEIEAMGGRIYRMCPIYPQNFGKYKKMLREFFCQHKEYRIIHSHMSELGYFAFREAKKQGVPVRICHAHNAPVRSSMTPKEKAQLVFRNYFKKHIIPFTDFMFICGDEAGNWLYGKENKARFITMKNAVDAEKFRFNPDYRKEIRNEFSLDDQLVIINVGRFNPQKNHALIIDIFKEIHSLRSDSKLILVGNGETQNEIKEKVHLSGLDDAVIFTGVRDDIHKLLSCADVFLFPSLYEGLPVTMVEAQASGIRCFISDAIPDQCILTDSVEVIGLSKSPSHWAQKIISSPVEYDRKSRYEDIRKSGFDIKDSAKWLQEFYLSQYKPV